MIWDQLKRGESNWASNQTPYSRPIGAFHLQAPIYSGPHLLEGCEQCFSLPRRMSPLFELDSSRLSWTLILEVYVIQLRIVRTEKPVKGL